ncbi:MAG: hypothetical protein ABSC92_17320 [Rhizomicrobium sp.]|jgi:hypothetical protein
MATRTITKEVTFRRPFVLTGFEAVQAAGTYTVDTEEEMIDALTYPAWRRTGTTLRLARAGATEFMPIDPEELSRALLRDGAQPEVAVGVETTSVRRKSKRDALDIDRVLGKRS